MDEKKTQEPEKVGFDDIMINQLVYCLSGSGILLNFLDRYEKFLYFGKDLTKEQKYMLRRDYGWTNEAIKYQGEATKAYKRFSYCLDYLQNIMDARVKTADYDSMNKDTNDMIALCLIYAAQVWTHQEAREAIHKYILEYSELDEDIRKVYEHFHSKSTNL